jgi:Flp pilus assembly protein TadD
MTRPGKKETKPRTDALDQAARHLRAGKLAEALALYRQLYDQEPEDWTVANALGDLHVRMNQTDEAIEVFMSLAEHMAQQGHTVKARALYRKVLRMRPNDPAATARVGELENEHLGANPLMQRVRGALLEAQAAAPPPAPAREAEPPVEVRTRGGKFF